MPKVKYLSIRFDNTLFPYEIPSFRAAIIEKTKRQGDLFHNHKGNNSFLYRYPLIQYKVMYKKASIVCLEDGTEEIHQLLKYKDLALNINGRKINFDIEDVNLHYHQVQVWDNMFNYSMLNWLALNSEHHKRYAELKDDPTQQKELLESILTGNIISFAKGISWQVEGRIKVSIDNIKELKILPYKKQKLVAFTLNFSTNVSLPNFIGLGKGSSIGFGSIKSFKQQRNINNNEQAKKKNSASGTIA